MNRRELLGVAAGGLSLAIAANKGFAAEEHEHGDHMSHDHAAHMGHPKLSEAARHCVSTGDACLNHCLALMAMGDTSLAACAKSVYAMMPICEALARLAASNAPRLPEFARVTYNICLDCEKECRKHENDHAECKACAESCAACAEECKKHST